MVCRKLTTGAVWILALCLISVLYAADTDRRLIEAVKSGNRESVRALLKQNVPVNAVDADGTTALHWAARADDMDTVQLLVRSGANPKAADRYGITPLSLAAEVGDARLVEFLIKAGADPNAVKPNGETILMIASRTGKPEAIKVLLANGAKVDARENEFGETALMWAAAENNAAAIRVLAEGGADKNARSTLLKFPEFKFITSGMVTTSLPRGGWTPLMYAARQGSIDAARALADAGADLNAADPEGSTALILAVINAHFDLAEALLEKHADPNIADSTGMTALYAAVDMHTLGPMLSRPGPKVTDNLDAADLVVKLLDHDANPNVRLKRPIIGRHHDSGDATMGEGTTPLIRATKNVDVPVIRSLLQGGADPSIPQKDYSTPMMAAIRGVAGTAVSEAKTIEAIQLFLDHGADVDAFNASGQTALHIAAGRGADEVVRFLASHGAKLDLKDKQNHTPLETAQNGGGGVRGAPVVSRQTTVSLLRQLMASR
jgi:ankyrin repeat protein